MGKICAPKRTLRAEGINHAADERVKRWERVRLVNITGQSGNFHRKIAEAGELEQICHRWLKRLAPERRAETHVVDDETQAWVAFGDLSDLGNSIRCENHNRNVVAFGRIPQPIRRAVFQPKLRTTLVKGDAYP